MERSSRFISLSGLSGVFAGLYALLGAYAANLYLNSSGLHPNEESYDSGLYAEYYFFVIDAAAVLLLAIGTGIFLTTRKARRDGNSIFDPTAKKLLINLCIPLFTGGLFCLALIFHGTLIYIAPLMLIFYGLSLINASKYTVSDVRVLGMIQVILGVISSFVVGYGLLFWSFGFGICHIAYGSYMYFKYER